MAKKEKILIADSREDTHPREVEVDAHAVGHLVRVGTTLYHHTHEDKSGRWIYVPTR